MKTFPQKPRDGRKFNPAGLPLFISLFLFCFINLNISLASPFRHLGLTTYINAEGINNFCGTNDIVLDAQGKITPIWNHTYSYQWEYHEPKIFPEWWNYPEGTSKELTIKVASVPFYLRVRCHVTEYVSGVYFTEWTTGEALLYVASAAPTNTNPSDVTICEGSTASFNSTASGQGGYTIYQWYEITPGGASSIISGATSSSYSMSPNPSISKNGYKYKCRASNGCGYIESDEAVLTINPNPVVELGSDRKICEGSTTVLTVGEYFNSYLWNTTQTTQSITVSSPGSYSVTVSDDFNCTASDNVNVFVDPPLSPINLGSDIKICKGSPLVISATGQYDTYLWNTGASMSSISPVNSGTYYVTAGLNSSACLTSDTINVSFAEPFEDEKICMVMVDPETGKNMIIWEKNPVVGTEKYQVLKIVSGTNFTLVKETLEADTSCVIDWNSKPRTKNDAYALVSIDTCGNVSQKSPWHKPFFLQTNIGKNDVINLDWEPYLVDGVEYIFKSIIIYRGTDSTKLAPINTIVGGIATVHYTDENPPVNVKLYYRIGGEKDVPCDPNHILSKKTSSGPYVHSLSNLEDNRLSLTGINNIKISNSLRTFPNPMKTESCIRWENPGGENFDLIIIDLKGNVVRTEKDLNAEEYILKRENLSPGCYILELRGIKTFHGRLFVD